MTQTEILEELKKLTTAERLEIIQAALYLIREDLQQVGQPLTRTQRRQQLAAAAEPLLPDYSAGGELTTFTALDGESFYDEAQLTALYAEFADEDRKLAEEGMSDYAKGLMKEDTQ
jgi:hypothetical protein